MEIWDLTENNKFDCFSERRTTLSVWLTTVFHFVFRVMLCVSINIKWTFTEKTFLVIILAKNLQNSQKLEPRKTLVPNTSKPQSFWYSCFCFLVDIPPSGVQGLQKDKKSGSNKLLVGLVVAFVFLILIVLGVVGFVWYRRKKVRQFDYQKQDLYSDDREDEFEIST